jgi:biopolymer transport protein ExbD
MSEVSSEGGGGGKHKGGKPKGKKASTHIDMTPMVDLAFLLLTFFMLTTSFNRPKTMEIIMPEKQDPNKPQIKINQDDVMNLLVGPNNRLFYYIGLHTDQVESTTYGVDGIQKVLMDPKYKSNPKFMVLIKATPDSKYKNIVNMFDIMRLTDTRAYALVDIAPQEITLISAKK